MRVQSPTLLIGVFIGTAMMTSGGRGLSIDLQIKKTTQLHIAQVQQRPPSKKASALQPNTKPRTVVNVQSPQQKSVWIVADKTLIQLGETINFKLEPEQLVAHSAYRFVFGFDDGSAPAAKIPGQPVRHRFASAGAHTVSAFAEAPPGLGPDEEGIDPITINVERVKLSANPLSAEVGIPVSLKATSVSKDANLRYRFTFGDNKPPSDWQESNKAAPHAYSAADQYRPKVEVGLLNGTQVDPLDSNFSEPIKVVLPPAAAVVFRVKPSSVKLDETVTLSAEFADKRRHIQYRFLFGDGRTTEWGDEASVAHSYSAGGWYQPSVEVGVVLDGTVVPLIMSAPQKVEVIAIQVPVASPLKTPSPEPRFPPPDWPLYLIIILIAVVVLTGTLVVTYKVVKWASAPKPTFTSHIDVGTATTDHGSPGSLVEFEVDLNPNVAEGSYEVFTSESRLVRAERSHQ
jgi:hypothetical protein